MGNAAHREREGERELQTLKETPKSTTVESRLFSAVLFNSLPLPLPLPSSSPQCVPRTLSLSQCHLRIEKDQGKPDKRMSDR
jgi:hypothetical protein